VELLLFQNPNDPGPVQVVTVHRPTQLYWHVHVDGLTANTAYAYRVYGPGGDVLGLFPDIYASTWNYQFKNTIRAFVRGDTGLVATVAKRIGGSDDIFEAGGFGPLNGICYVSCHDGFTLNDLVSYNQKHNEANGEDSGDNDNISRNYGVEGPSSDPQIEALRKRQIQNFLSILFLSQGVPMLLAGDECRRTQQGNNNPYVQDNQVSWFDWTPCRQTLIWSASHGGSSIFGSGTLPCAGGIFSKACRASVVCSTSPGTAAS
jgi:glycogen operon protein